MGNVLFAEINLLFQFLPENAIFVFLSACHIDHSNFMRLTTSLRIQITQFAKQFLRSNEKMCATPTLPASETEMAEQKLTIMELSVGSREIIVCQTIAIVAWAAIVICLFGRMYRTTPAAVCQLQTNEIVLVGFLI